MPLGNAYGGPDLTSNNDQGVIYGQGSEFEDDSWRFSFDPITENFCVEHREALVEEDITLDNAKVATIESGPYDDDVHYTASVAIDARVPSITSDGLSGDMTGRVIHWNGFIWTNFDDQWIDKADFQKSGFLSDFGRFRRANILRAEPDVPNAHPPTPTEGMVIGSRNTDPGGFGAEIMALTSSQGVFGGLLAMVHGSEFIPFVTIDQIGTVKLDGTPVAIPYENTHVAKTYAVGDVIVNKSKHYVAKEAGAQTSDFPAEAFKWDAYTTSDLSRAVINETGEILTNEAGQIVFFGDG